MAQKRVLAVLLEGFDPILEQKYRAAGELPVLERLRQSSAVYDLDHGPDPRMGLFGEQIAAGLTPEAGERYSVVEFDSDRYIAAQQGALLRPFTDSVDGNVVVFDIPYFGLELTDRTQGILNWGPHDPGGPFRSRPESITDELIEKFGPYPAEPYVWGITWNSLHHTREACRTLVESVDIRSDAARWLLGDRLPEWDLALLSVTEPHSATEQLWHGIDTEHPLHQHPTAAIAAEGMLDVFRATDRLVGSLIDDFPDASVVVFSMHGMGSNSSDVSSMVLFPELMSRAFAGTALFEAPAGWSSQRDQIPSLAEDEHWLPTIKSIYEGTYGVEAPRRPLPERLRRKVMRRVNRLRGARAGGSDDYARELEWHPTYRYHDLWPQMKAFPVPSFDDGRVRVNLIGREAKGVVPLADYERTLDEVEALARSVVNPRTGESVVKEVARPVLERGDDPMTAGSSAYDLAIVWNDTNAFEHPEHGLIGPIPYRRTGGHTGKYGEAYVSDPDVVAGERGLRSSYDVVPTLFELLGQPIPSGMSGTPLLRSEEYAS